LKPRVLTGEAFEQLKPMHEPAPLNPSPSHTRFAWRAVISVLIAASFLFLVLSGIILFLSPPGRVANWTNWAMLGLRKQEWISLHVWFSTLFLAAALLHVFFNWRPLLSYFKGRLTRRLSFRREWVVAVVICGSVYAGTRAGVPPFSTLLAFGDKVKESWDQPQERAPIPHAELLTLAELSQKAAVDLTDATNRLHAAGITNFQPETLVREIAEKNARSGKQLYDLLLNQAVKGGEKSGAGTAHGSGPGSGGGPGRKTLSQFCSDAGIDLQQALARLKAKGIQASAELTLREIAVNNGYNRPYELLEIIQGEAKKPN
jgi:hypothetical protein